MTSYYVPHLSQSKIPQFFGNVPEFPKCSDLSDIYHNYSLIFSNLKNPAKVKGVVQKSEMFKSEYPSAHGVFSKVKNIYL